MKHRHGLVTDCHHLPMVPIVPQLAPMVSVADVSVKLYLDPPIAAVNSMTSKLVTLASLQTHFITSILVTNSQCVKALSESMHINSLNPTGHYSGLFYRCIYPKGCYSGLAIYHQNPTGLYSGQMAKTSYGEILCVEHIQWLLYCIVSIHLLLLYIYSAHQSEALPVQKTQREESSLERTKRGTWLSWLTS